MGIALIWSIITILVRWIFSKVGFGGFPSWLSVYYVITLNNCSPYVLERKLTLLIGRTLCLVDQDEIQIVTYR